MCGIFAAFLNRPLTPEDIAKARDGVAALVHRGPDGSGEWIDAEKGVYLGHRRLAVVDLGDTSSQPMAVDGHVLAYNGEAYNFRELRSELTAKGHRFRSQGDVEVVLRGWISHGAGLLDLLDGMFAFALWDGNEAHLAVDSFGEKPLFIAEVEDGIWISSEIGPLVRVLALKPSITGPSLTAFLCLGNFPAPMTAFPAVKKVRPASVMSIRNGRIVRNRSYWSVPAPIAGKGKVKPLGENDLDKIATVLCESIERRLIADVPLGLFLSSGVDSSLVAALASRELGRALECLTVSFPKGSVADEAADAAMIAAHLELPHRVFLSEDDSASTTPAALIDLFGQPSENVSAFPVVQLSNAVSGSITVALTGIGGDELTCGYGKNVSLFENRQRYALMSKLSSFAPVARKMLGPGFLTSVFELYAAKPEEVYLAIKNYPVLTWLRELDGYDSWVREEFSGFEEPSYEWVQRYEKTRTLPNEHLHMLDLASMRSSLELRTPFLSRALAELMAQFDLRSMLGFGQKSVLRRILSRYLPPALVDIPKKGFRFPQERFVAARGANQPSIGSLQPSVIHDAWVRRSEGKGWERLALRLIALEEFLGRPPTPEAGSV